MAPSRKSRSVNKRFSYTNEAASDKYGEIAHKSGQKKRKLSDMLGPQWSKEELDNFYEAYRTYGKDWKKVAAVVRHRSVEMVEALYTMNKAYLSLPEGIASVVGLKAMMTDHYSILGGSDSEQESIHDAGTSRKRQKHAKGKLRSEASKGLGHSPDFSESHPMASSNDCLSLLKNRRSGIRPHAVKKRTPRFPVAYSNDKDNSRKYYSPARQGLKLNADANDDVVAHEIALALTEASHRSGSPLVSRTPKRKAKGTTPLPVRNDGRRPAESEMTITRLRAGEMDEGGCELSLGSTEADNEDYGRDKEYAMDREVGGTLKFQQRWKRYFVNKEEVEESKNKNNNLEDIKEACSGTEEGQEGTNTIKGKLENKVARSARSFYKEQRKKNKKALVGGDEGSPFDALQTLADISLMMPETADTESSAHVKAENFNIANKSKLKGSRSIPGDEHTAFKTSKLGKLKEGVHQSNTGQQKRKQKSMPFKLQVYSEVETDCTPSDNQKTEDTVEVKSGNKGKRSSHHAIARHPKQGKLVMPVLNASSTPDRKREESNSGLSTVQVPSANQANFPTKDGSKWKMDMQKSSIPQDRWSAESILDDQPDKLVPSFRNRKLNTKEKLSNCLSRYQVRRWCAFEWFYSAIDYPWFARREFVEYLNHVGLGHVPRLTRVEWGVIRSSLGRPRRFSELFLKEEKEKLNQYRESVRTHYAELNAGTREGLPTDLARPLSVGQHVIAFHPKTREIHNGIVLTVDHCRCHVQFDQPELGVEYIMDVDCMPLKPVENLPASFTKHNACVNRYTENLKELKVNEQLKQGKAKGYMKVASIDNLESASVPRYVQPLTHYSNKSSMQTEGKSSSFLQAKVGPGETAITQVSNSQPSIAAQIQAKEADVQAVFELTRVLDKKEAVVSELRRMNDEVLENQRDGENSIRDSEPFKKEYAAVLLQLSQVNDQVSSALCCLRQRNTYRGSSPLTLVKPMVNLSDPGGCSSSCGYSCQPRETESHVHEIVESSRAKARKMVDAAMQEFSSSKENNLERIEEVIDFVSNRLSDDPGTLAMGSSTIPADPVIVSKDQSTACTSKALETSCAPDRKSNSLSNESNHNEEKVLSDLIVNCVAAFMMIQACTARQFPPADVAQVLDHAVTSLQPICPQNLSLYGEILKCMGIIRNQILALVPT